MREALSSEISKNRSPGYPIHPLILNRWSPRAMSGEEIEEVELMSLFEAARWAPSSYNNQPWRFLYGKKGSPHWNKFFELLIDFNKSWCDKAAVLGLIISRKTFEKNNKPSITHSFDAGAAWENFSLEGTSRNLVVHGMEGFDYVKARENLKVPNDYEVLSMFAVGKKAPKETLSAELQAREVPSKRKELREIVMEGMYK